MWTPFKDNEFNYHRSAEHGDTDINEVDYYFHHTHLIPMSSDLNTIHIIINMMYDEACVYLNNI